MARLFRFAPAALILCAGSLAPAQEPEDPYQWLEEVGGEKALAWVKERNSESLAELTRSAAFEALNRRLLGILDSEARIPAVDRRGTLYYNFWRDARNPRGLWRRTSLDEYRKDHPRWETVLDLDALAQEEHENWVWRGARSLRPDYKRALVSLSRGGADASVVREFDLPTRRFVKDGFTLKEAKSQLSWRSLGSVFVGTDFGAGSLTSSGYPRIVKQWTRGTPLEGAALVFEGRPDDMSVSAERDLTPGFERDVVTRRITLRTSYAYLRQGDKLQKIEKPDDAIVALHRQWLLLRLRSDWSAGGKTYRAGSLLATELESFQKGGRVFDVLYEPAERRSLAQVSRTRNYLLLSELDNIRARISVLTHQDGRWRRAPLPGLPEFTEASLRSVDPDDSDDYFLETNDFLTPTTLSLGTAGNGPGQPLKHLPAFFDTKNLAVTQREAVSQDGTRIPYFEVAPKELVYNGKNPTLLLGYGGFEIPMLPSYRPIIGAGWLERGGVFVLANIRGGGEFGPAWHRAALKADRHKAYEDFIAVALDLIGRKVTAPEHLGAMGRSNGGLLVGNMLTRRPDLFGAIACGSPLLDMRRYNHLLAGASWMSEYGNPDLPAEWEYIRTFSPYHLVQQSSHYPRTLFTTSTRDDRVHPGHARKMAAKMREWGHDVLYYENTEGGHAAAADNKQSAFMAALEFTFLWKELTR
jgi:prolyl oligopeptidase